MKNIKREIRNINNIKKEKDIYKWFAYILGVSAFILSFFHRVNSTTLVPDLIKTFNVSSSSLGILSSLYFYSYAAMQPAIGILTDRWKPKKIFIAFLIIEGIGTLLYAYATIFPMVLLGRMLVGIGCAGIFIPLSWIIRMYFPRDKRGFLFSIQIFFANFGSVLAASPLAFLIHVFGWRIALGFFGVLAFFIAFLFGLFVRDKKEDEGGIDREEEILVTDESIQEIPREKEKKGWIYSIKEVFKIPIIKYALLSLLAYGAMISLQGLWAIPFLLDIYKMNRLAASKIVAMIPLGFMIGVLSLGKISDTKYGKYFFFYLNVGSTLVYLFFTVYTHQLFVTGLYILFFLIGVFHGMVPFIYKAYSVIFPKKIYGVALGIINIFPLLVGALYQSITGYMFDYFNFSDNISNLLGYKYFFLFLTVSLIIATVSSYIFIKLLDRDFKGKI